MDRQIISLDITGLRRFLIYIYVTIQQAAINFLYLTAIAVILYLDLTSTTLIYNIIPLYILPHLSYLLQTLDVSYFVTLKQLYSRLIEDYMRLSIYHINKLDFITVYLTSYIEALTASNIYSGFTAIGLVLFNPS